MQKQTNTIAAAAATVFGIVTSLLLICNLCMAVEIPTYQSCKATCTTPENKEIEVKTLRQALGLAKLLQDKPCVSPESFLPYRIVYTNRQLQVNAITKEQYLNSMGMNADCFNFVMYTFLDFEYDSSSGVLKPKVSGTLESYLRLNALFGVQSLEDAHKELSQHLEKGNRYLFVSLFGAESRLNFQQIDAIKLGNAVATYINSNLKYIHGIDLDLEDTNFFQTHPDGISYIKTLITTIRNTVSISSLKFSISPQAPYFSKAYANNIFKLDQAIGEAILFYNIQYYNQVQQYNDYDKIFLSDEGSYDNVRKSINPKKIVIGVTRTKDDLGLASQPYYIPPTQIGQYLAQYANAKAFTEFGGIALWAYNEQATTATQCEYITALSEGYKQNIKI